MHRHETHQYLISDGPPSLSDEVHDSTSLDAELPKAESSISRRQPLSCPNFGIIDDQLLKMLELGRIVVVGRQK
jgi:hypothetical protein